MRLAVAMLLISAEAIAQQADPASPARLSQELRAALQNDSLTSAAEIAVKLDSAVQARYSAWLVRDSRERVDEVLSWLPGDAESLWVNQYPFTIDPAEQLNMLYGRPIQGYSVDHLMAVNQGRIYRALDHRTIRLVVAATRGAQPPKFDRVAVPRGMPRQDVAYFYFFTEPVGLPPPDESVDGRPVWHESAISDTPGDDQPEMNRAPRGEGSWLALARPDLLVLVNRKELLGEILDRAARKPRREALPATLPEWVHADRSAPFWGLRHYTKKSKPSVGAPGCGTAELPEPDCDATGVIVRFDTALQRLEIRYLSENQPARRAPMGSDALHTEFQLDQPQKGVWRLTSDIQKRGAWPVHFALIMLGFGTYQ